MEQVLPKNLRRGVGMEDQQLSRAIAMTIGDLEREGELVITNPSVQLIADRIAEAVLAVVPNTSLSLDELSGIRSLILHAFWNKQFLIGKCPLLPASMPTSLSR